VDLVTRVHFRSRNNDGGHTIRSAVVETPVLHANLMALSVIEPKLWAIEIYITGIGISDLIFAPMTLTLTR